MIDGGSETPMVESGRIPIRGQELARTLQHQGERLKEQMETIDERTRAFVHDHPIMAVGLAAVCGYVVARIVSRW
ncbi:MAG: hypothetical protein M9894_08385 [Planctomycetes bacterium]|nr:hypothetical protein [Planctomycetota bacterium]